MGYDGGTQVGKIYPPKNHLQEMGLLDSRVTPMRLSFTSSKTAISLTSKTYIDRKWSKGNVQKYISPYCLNTSVHNTLVEHCNNVNALKFVNWK